MERRAFLRQAAAGAGLSGLVGLAGCWGNDGNRGTLTPSQTYVHNTFSPTPTFGGIVNTTLNTSRPEDGKLVVSVGLENNSPSEQTADVVVSVTFDRKGTVTPGTVTKERTREVTLDGNGEKTIEFTFDHDEGATMTNLDVTIGKAD